MNREKTTARAHIVALARKQEAERQRREALSQLDEAEGKLRLFSGAPAHSAKEGTREQRALEEAKLRYFKACEAKRNANEPTIMMMAFTNARCESE